MTKEIAVRIDSVGKLYRIGASYHHTTIREHATHLIGAPVRRLRRMGQAREGANPTIWAVRDISFDVGRGEVLGIVGRNGAGKSTLLKILSRITAPTEGQIEIHGRVGSLLEVGTGFHGELTGRENVFLNGAILGMHQAEIKRKFNDIVAFAEIEEFIDTPVKHYSSGMYVRLAFAVAAHLEPEILIVDEVLAVGDAAFQKKCLGKMSEVARSGRTVLFVSHNMGAVAELCTRAVLLEKGRKIADGSVAHIIEEYSRVLNAGQQGSVARFEKNADADFQILAVATRGPSGTPSSTFGVGDTIEIEIEYELRRPFRDLVVCINLSRNMIDVFHSYDTDASPEIEAREVGRYIARHRLPSHFLKAGIYEVECSAGTPTKLLEAIEGAAQFEIEELGENTQHRGYRKDRPGSVISPGTWSTEVIEPATTVRA